MPTYVPTYLLSAMHVKSAVSELFRPNSGFYPRPKDRNLSITTQGGRPLAPFLAAPLLAVHKLNMANSSGVALLCLAYAMRLLSSAATFLQISTKLIVK